MPSGIFGARSGASVGTPINLDGAEFILLDGQLVITPMERYPSTDAHNEKSYKARKRAHKREKKRLQRA